MNIVVLCGGLSMERDVSITSGTLIAKALQERGHNVVLVDSFLGFPDPYDDPKELFTRHMEIKPVTVSEQEPDLEAVKKSRVGQTDNSILGSNVLEICAASDITFLALHGEEGENGKLQATLDVHGIKYTGSGYLGSALAMNKTLTKELCEYNGVKTPAGITVYAGKRSASEYADVGFPCVVKPCSGGSSVGTSIVQSRAEYEKALELAFKFEDAVIVEQYVRGRELTCGVIDGKAMPVIEIIPKEGFYDYKNKYQSGMTTELCPAPLTAEETKKVQTLSERVNSVLMVDAYSRVDFILDDKGEIYCLEANTLPGMTATSLLPQSARAVGIGFPELCDRICRSAIGNRKPR